MEPKVVELLSKTAEFDEIISNLADRCFAVLENVSREQIGDDINTKDIGLNDEESEAFSTIIVTFTKLISKLSKNNFDPLMERMKKYAKTHVLEPVLAGPMFALMVKAFANTQPEETLNFFIPHLCSQIENILQEKSLYFKVTNNRNYILLHYVADMYNTLHKQLMSKRISRPNYVLYIFRKEKL